MSRLRIGLLLVCGCCALMLLGQPMPSRAAPCQELLPPGEYSGPASAVVDYVYRSAEQPNAPRHVRITDSGELSLKIDCGVTGVSSRWVYQRTITENDGSRFVCGLTETRGQVPGTVRAGANGLPLIEIPWGSGAISAYNCPVPNPGTSELKTWQLQLTGPPQGRTLAGDFRLFEDELEIYEAPIDLFRSVGDTVEITTFTRQWSLTRQPQPAVQGLNSSLRQQFLTEIPVTNRFTAALDWDEATPGTARLIVGSEPPRPMAVNGSSASLDLPLTSIMGTGDFPLSVEAELNGRVARRDGLGTLTLVALPDWVRPFNMQAVVQGDHVRYQGSYALPQRPLDAHVVLPSLIPYIGGTWGLLPTQLRLELAANSLGSRETGGLTAQGGFGLGKRTYTLLAQGNIYGTLGRDLLRFESDELRLATPPISFREELGLVTIIPGASALFDLPVIGELLRGVNATLGISAEIHGAATGRARLAVNGSELQISEGGYDASLGVLAAGGLDTPLLALNVAGGGDGALRMRLIPRAQVEACQVLLAFRARAAALGYSLLMIEQAWPLYSCDLAGAQISQLSPELGVPQLWYGDPAAAAGGETSLLLPSQSAAGDETILAEGVSLQARPQLAAGPDGQMALVWNSLSPRGAADAIILRWFDGTTWGAVQLISPPARPAFAPALAFTRAGTLLVVWAEAQADPNPTDLTVAFARSFEIAWAELQPNTGTVLRRGLLTNDAVLDLAPRLRSAPDGTLWLAWQHSPATNLAGSLAQPNQLRVAAWSSNGWSVIETAVQRSVGTLFWDLVAAANGQLWLVADQDLDGDLASASDREIFLYQRSPGGWNDPRRLTNDSVVDRGPLLALGPDGWPIIAWQSGERLLGQSGDPAQARPTPWFEPEAELGANVAAGRLLVAANGGRTLLWTDASASGQDVWYSRFDPARERWSQPAPIFADATQRRSLSVVPHTDGSITLAMLAAPIANAPVTFEGGGSGLVPTVSEQARLLVAQLPADLGTAQRLFLPLVVRR